MDWGEVTSAPCSLDPQWVAADCSLSFAIFPSFLPKTLGFSPSLLITVPSPSSSSLSALSLCFPFSFFQNPRRQSLSFYIRLLQPPPCPFFSFSSLLSVFFLLAVPSIAHSLLSFFFSPPYSFSAHLAAVSLCFLSRLLALPTMKLPLLRLPFSFSSFG